MASSSDNTKERCENLQFKEWLIQKISSGKFRDLEWIDSDQQRIFKLPWTKKNYPHWEEHHEIFYAWAQYRSIVRNDPKIACQPASHMKSNFRTILRKCGDIEELKNFHQLGLQTGNYKVYKVLTEQEAVVKRHKPVLQSLCQSAEPENDIIEISTTSGHGSDVQLPPDFNIPASWIERSTSLSVALLEAEQPLDKRCSDELLDFGPKSKVRKTQATQTKRQATQTPVFPSKEVVFLADSVTSFDELSKTTTISKEQAQEFSENESLRKKDMFENAEGFNILLEAAEITSESLSSGVALREPTALAPSSFPPVSEVFKSLNVSEEQLGAYDVLIKYGRTEIWNGVYNELNKGYRIHNDAEDAKGSFVNKLPYLSVKLPTPSDSMGRFFDTVMTNMNDGLILKLDSNCNLVAKRLCLSRIFVSSSFTELDSSEAISLVRHEEIVIFSYSQFLNCLYSSLQSKQILPMSKLKIFISIGKKIKGDINNSKVYIAMQLIPKAAENMLHFTQLQPDADT